jgi:hypothetical protein
VPSSRRSTNGTGWGSSGDSFVVRYEGGEPRWTVGSKGETAGHISASYGGTFRRVAGVAHGIMFAQAFDGNGFSRGMDGAGGRYYAWDADGLWVGDWMTDARVPDGAPAHLAALSTDNLAGVIVPDGEDALYYASTDIEGRIWRIRGFDRLVRTSGELSLGPAQPLADGHGLVVTAFADASPITTALGVLDGSALPAAATSVVASGLVVPPLAGDYTLQLVGAGDLAITVEGATIAARSDGVVSSGVAIDDGIAVTRTWSPDRVVALALAGTRPGPGGPMPVLAWERPDGVVEPIPVSALHARLPGTGLVHELGGIRRVAPVEDASLARTDATERFHGSLSRRSPARTNSSSRPTASPRWSSRVHDPDGHAGSRRSGADRPRTGGRDPRRPPRRYRRPASGHSATGRALPGRRRRERAMDRAGGLLRTIVGDGVELSSVVDATMTWGGLQRAARGDRERRRELHGDLERDLPPALDGATSLRSLPRLRAVQRRARRFDPRR